MATFFTKEDLNYLPIDRLVEMIFELIDENENLKKQLSEKETANPFQWPIYPPYEPYIAPLQPTYPPQVWYQKNLSGPCFGGGQCTNPHHDCINCPSPYGQGGTYTSNGTSGVKINTDSHTVFDETNPYNKNE